MQQEKMNLKEWNEADRPREKCIERGLSSLSDAELIAVLLRSGTTTETVVDMSKRLLSKYDNSLSRLSNCTLKELQEIKGIGQTKAVTLQVAFELGRRQLAEKVKQEKLDSPQKVYNYMFPKNVCLDHEEFWVLYLNQSSILLKAENVGKGGLTSTVVDVRLIMRRAIELSSTCLILCHNHPSGDVLPSKTDNVLTQQIVDAGKLLNVQVMDHVVVSSTGYYSYRQEGRLG